MCIRDRSKDTSAAATGKLIVGFDQSYPPYGYVGDDGEYTGFDLDLARAVAEEQGWELELEAIDWDAKDTMLESGAINCIWNGFTMDNREDDYTFSDPYMLNAQVVVVRADSGIEDAEDLAGKTVVTQVDSAAEAVLKDDAADLAATFASLETIEMCIRDSTRITPRRPPAASTPRSSASCAKPTRAPRKMCIRDS